jgi:chromosome segregation ATPase
MDAANQEKTELQQSLLSAREELSEKEDKLAKIVAEHDSLVKELRSDTLQYKEQYDAILKEKTGLKEKITELESKNTAQKEQILKSEAALRESKETISSQNTAIATLEGQIAGLKQQQEAEQKVVDKKSGKFEEISQKNIHMWNALRMVILMSNLGQRGQEIIQTSKNEIISDTDKKIEEWTKEIYDLSSKIKTNTEQITSFGKLRKKHKNPKKILLKNIELHYKAYRKLW